MHTLSINFISFYCRTL